eukprot:XP_001689889.1 predicted protein [Chlamydomonas reinhardtii]
MVARALMRASCAAAQPLAQLQAAASQLVGLCDGQRLLGLSVHGDSGTSWRALSSPAFSGTCPSGPPAFSFDIDGVLIRGKHVLQETLEAVKKLTTTEGRWRYPVVFMTNGGGVCEERKAAQLSGWLGIRVAPSQVILSHTPMRDLVPQLAEAPVLVSGRGDVLAVARGYGLGRVLHTRQLGRAMPAATPFSSYPPPVRGALSDLLWANEFPKNRFGQGAFAHMVLSLYSRLTCGGRPAHVTFYGKPNPQPYRLAERLLLAQAHELGLALPEVPTGTLPFSGIYAVGDNPAADVRGANQAGAPWVSVLVRTGVFQGPGPNCDIDTARIAVDDVAAGVEAALHHTRSLRWHSMR